VFDVIPTPRFLRQVKSNSTYKIRLAIESKNSGKSGGARIITYVVTEQKEVYLVSIYDKSEISTIKDSDIKKLIKEVEEELD
jgi:hypothetical protein